MRRVFGVLSIALMALLASSVFAQEPMEKTQEEEVEATAPMQGMMGSGMMGRMMPMMQGTMGQQGMMGGQGMMNMMPMMQGMMSGFGMMGGGMMCPMCGRMMGQQGMMGQMPMMGGQGMMSMMKPHMAGLADKLDLSEDQQNKLKALHTSFKKDMIRKNADREIAQIDLDELIQQEEPDLNAVEMQIQKIADLEAMMKYSWVKLWTDARSLLTEEQRAAFKKLMRESKASIMEQMMGGQKAKPDNPSPEPGRAEHHK